MSTAALLLVKDEADIIAATLRHLAWHVDEIFVADNMSDDGTIEILDELSQELNLRYRLDREAGHYHGTKMTALAQEALEAGHRWALACDADEIWYAPEGRPIRDWLAGFGREHQFVKATMYVHVTTAHDPGDAPDPVRRLGWRRREPLEMRWGKIAVRLRPDLVIDEGNHTARTLGTGTTGYGLELRHFPYRSAEQFVAKIVKGCAGLRAAPDLGEGVSVHWRTYGRVIEEGGPEAGMGLFHDEFWSSDPKADETLVYDPAPVRGELPTTARP